ncbi:MAG: hypothetical protein HFG81_04040 [Dorea sp.]|uniref:hypothetical protein n=1 Tax=Sporofaciens musculi TaxID=2681861 RepID=UPI0021712D5F|nr:hypothetical protein [Sporofaciens musculi]MCI9421872.1 hypothetical protein [Dorea sp.]
MIEINDELLLKEIIGFCESIKDEDELKKFQGNNKELPFYPLDSDVKNQLDMLKKKGTIKRDGEKSIIELSYEMNGEIDKLWNMLIEKAIICLRYFDKREPFMENGKQPYVYGLDSLEDYHKKYIDFEGVLYGSDAYYRDHVFHVIRVWLLGVYFLLNDNTFITGEGKRLIDVIHFEGDSDVTVERIDKGEIDKEYQEKNDGNGIFIKKGDKFYKIHKDETDSQNFALILSNSFSSQINILEKISMWTLMALCHDLGYPLEKSKKILAKTENMMEAFVAQPNISGDLRFDGTRDSNNKDIILFTSKKMKATNIDGEIATYKASVQEKYKFKYMLSLEAFAHGVISSIIIYKKLNYFKETDNNSDANYIFQEEDARQFYIRRDILRAMASHTCQDIYHIDVATFPMLLFVCDELQEWGRKSWKSMYKGVTNNAVQLSIKTFNSDKIEYEEEIDMSNAGNQQLVDNIERILKHQYMLYQTTFRDGQYTARRKFDFNKHIHIKISEEYKSIKQIDIDFSINHGSDDNKFLLSIRDSGDIDKSKKSMVRYLTESLSELLKPYIENRKYGICEMKDDREKVKK